MFYFILISCLLNAMVIADEFSQLEGYTHRNGDCPGHDIESIKQTTLGVCAARCNALPNCKSFLFNDLGSRSYCWLKTSECPLLVDTYIRNYHFHNKMVSEENAGGNIEVALRNCTMTRVNDAMMLAGSWEPLPDIKTEGECAAKCEEVTVCDSATFKNETRECRIHPRRAFVMGYISGGDCCVMFEKKCPFLKNLNHLPPRKQILCPLRFGAMRQPSKKFAYRVMRYEKSFNAGEYSCRIDDLCKAVSYEAENDKLHFTFYHDLTPNDENTPVSNFTAVKVCNENGPSCDSLTAYLYKSLKGAQPYDVPKVGKADCVMRCVKSAECVAATFTSAMRKECKLYRLPQGGIDLEEYTGRGRAMTWVKPVEKCSVVM
ncbi:uncharacterized protein LOC135491217 [Lineus longissimus]|uniref:uncharacterized protein LOC135491217 n=1 Tax=Lineus longissimus TaxID=88925 RepID=UPI002B4F6F35